MSSTLLWEEMEEEGNQGGQQADEQLPANVIDLFLVGLGFFIMFSLCWRLRRVIMICAWWSCYLAAAALVVSIGLAILYPNGFILVQNFVQDNKHHVQQSQGLSLGLSILYDIAKNLHISYRIAKGRMQPTPPPSKPPPRPPIENVTRIKKPT